jgi:uncharacterized membrane protein YGL010W
LRAHHRLVRDGLSLVDALPSLPVKINWAWVMILLAVIYYTFLSLRLALGAALMFAAMAWSINALAHSVTIPLWWIFAGAFVLAWIGQFVGHSVEGKRPSFPKDLLSADRAYLAFVQSLPTRGVCTT